MLNRHVARRSHKQGKVRVADSKKVHSGPHGLRHLEEKALCFYCVQHGELPTDLASWLATGTPTVPVDAGRDAPCP